MGTRNTNTSYIRLCDFAENEKLIKTEFLKIADEVIRSEYVIRDDNRGKITDLLKYFTGNPCELNPNKGIYIFGTYGCGKTVLFKTIQLLLARLFPFSPNGFQITSLEQIIEKFKAEKNLDYFGYREDSTPNYLCINEFGKRLDEKIFGTDANAVITSLFMIRYELFQQGYYTHITSNFHPKDLELEPVVRDRLNEMFNFVEFKGESFRR